MTFPNLHMDQLEQRNNPYSILTGESVAYYVLITSWACLATFFMVRSKLEAMAIYVVKQACGHDI